MRTDFYEETHPHGGIQRVWRFKNGYGASVIQHSFSYGASQGLWELAVIKWGKKNRFSINYDTPITNDVLGYLTDLDVGKLLSQIEKLPKLKEA